MATEQASSGVGEYRIQEWGIGTNGLKKSIRLVLPDIGCLFITIDGKKPVTSINKVFRKMFEDRKKYSASYKKHFKGKK